MHKIVVLKRGSHYVETSVPFDKSQNDIIKLLRKHNCTKIAPLEQAGDPTLYTLFFEKDRLPYILEFPITYVEKHESNSYSPLIKELKMQISGRVIHDRIKALLIEVEYGISDFEEVMLPHLLIRNEEGKSEELTGYLMRNKEQLSKGKLFDTVQNLLPGAK
jgi:hypothetical protein